ncbi:hypothetical protein [Streptomyces sp. NPDC057877]|uniref:hypothetical protein n=1 Tax=Streptomyces sp. NPDC057877 TaxID=3346269 RepID=UPI00369C583E
MRKRMLRSVLVAAFSAVVAVGTLAGLSGAKGDAHEADGEQPVVVADVGEQPAYFPADSKWD